MPADAGARLIFGDQRLGDGVPLEAGEAGGAVRQRMEKRRDGLGGLETPAREVIEGAVGDDATGALPAMKFKGCERQFGEDGDQCRLLVGVDQGRIEPEACRLLRRRGIDIRTSSYLQVSLITVPVVLLTTSIALWISLSYL